MIRIIKIRTLRYARNHHGATAVEFALFAIPLTMLIIGLIEMSMLAAAGTLLQGATDDTARLVRTGQVQSSADPQGTFEDMLCDSVDLFLDCERLVYEAIVMEDGLFSSAGSSTVEPQFDPDGNLEAQGFDPGEENDVVLIRVAYRYPLLTPFIGPFFADEGVDDNTHLLMSTTVIKNEPYVF